MTNHKLNEILPHGFRFIENPDRRARDNTRPLGTLELRGRAADVGPLVFKVQVWGDGTHEILPRAGCRFITAREMRDAGVILSAIVDGYAERDDRPAPSDTCPRARGHVELHIDNARPAGGDNPRFNPSARLDRDRLKRSQAKLAARLARA